MTAKQQLLEYVQGLTEEEAEEKLPWLLPAADRRLSDSEKAAIERGLADLRAGRFVPLEELEAELEDAEV